jgi:hypothetical protein
MSYTNIDAISEELGGFTIDNDSTPNNTTVNEWITEVESIIVERTGKEWETTTATDEYHDYDGSGSVFVEHSPIISVTTLSKEVNGIGASSEDWKTLTEGRLINTDFYVYKTDGEIIFHGSTQPSAGFQNLKITYTYGKTTCPNTVQHLATLMVGRRVINTVINNTATSEGGSLSVGTITIQDPSIFGDSHVTSMKKDEEELLRTIGVFKTYKFNRRYNN